MKISVLGVKGDGNFEVEIIPQARVEDLMHEIEKMRPDWPVVAQRLIYLGAELKDKDASLTQAQVQEGNPVVVILRKTKSPAATPQNDIPPHSKPDAPSAMPPSSPPKAEALELLRPQHVAPVETWITVGTPSLMQNCGSFYYEVKIGRGVQNPQLGWVTEKFHRGPKDANGVGDDVESCAVDGIRHLLWQNGDKRAEWPRTWREGDVIGLAIDINTGEMQFSLNGDWVEGLRNKFQAPGQNVYPAVSATGYFSIILASSAWQYSPPSHAYRAWAESGTYERPVGTASPTAPPTAPPTTPPTAPTPSGPNFKREITGSQCVRETDIETLCLMGFEREAAVKSLAASFGNIERAIEYLTNGIPEEIQKKQTAKLSQDEMMALLEKHSSGPDDAREKIERIMGLVMTGQDVNAYPDLAPLLPVYEFFLSEKGKGKGNGNGNTKGKGEVRESPQRISLDFGPLLLKQSLQNVATEDVLAGVKRIGLYFGGQWCPHCPPFSAKLKVWVEDYKKLDPGFEVVYISGDRSEAEAHQYFTQHMGAWLMRPYSQPFYRRLSGDCNSNGIPTLVICSSDGSIITHDGRGLIEIPPTIVAQDCLLHLLKIDDEIECSQFGANDKRLLQILPPGTTGTVKGFDEDSMPIIQLDSQTLAIPRNLIRAVQRGDKAKANEADMTVDDQAASKKPPVSVSSTAASPPSVEATAQQVAPDVHADQVGYSANVDDKKVNKQDAQREAAERRAKLDAERRAQEHADRKAKEDADRLDRLESLLQTLDKHNPGMANAAASFIESFTSTLETAVAQSNI